MKQYLDLLEDIQANGCIKGDRTGTGTTSVFGRMMRFDLRNGFPLVTTKKIHFKSVVHELLWFISGDTNTKYLVDNGVKIWNEWADENGELGPVYGFQWRHWPSFKWSHEGYEREDGCDAQLYVKDEIDQLANVIGRIQTHPYCRRHIVSAWNVADVPDMALSPCHSWFQFNCRPIPLSARIDLLMEADSSIHSKDALLNAKEEDSHQRLDELNIPEHYLDCQMYQRSVDSFLGLPFNIASYALLNMMVAQVTNKVAGDLVWIGGDTHLYSNHMEQVATQLTRTPHALSTVKLNKDVKDIDSFTFDDIVLENYESDGPIKAPIAI